MSRNTVLNNTISGIYYDTILKDNQAFPYGTMVGNNKFADNEFVISLIRRSRAVDSSEVVRFALRISTAPSYLAENHYLAEQFVLCGYPATLRLVN